MSQTFPDREQNPYAAPLAEVVASADAEQDPETRDLAIFVGRNARYYLAKWGPVRDRGSGAGFNWAAFLFSGIWLLYRKMYRIAAIFFGIVLAESLFEELLFNVLLQTEAPAGLDRIVSLAISIICGGWGNKWYLAHAKRAIDEIDRQRLDEGTRQYLIAERGGTKLWMALLLFVTYCVVVGLLFIGLEMLLLDEI